MKATKRLTKSIVALVASLVLCVGVCIAWFATSNFVDSKGSSSQLQNVNISVFKVTAYHLKAGATDGAYIIGDKIDDAKMDGYGEITNDKDARTAVLLEIEYEFVGTQNKSYNIYANCSEEVRSVEKDDKKEDNFICNLSDAVKIFRAELNGGNVTLAEGGELDFFATENDATVKKNLTVNADAISDVARAGVCRVVLDYDDMYIAQLYAIALDKDGTLSSKMDFTGDIEIYIEEIL